MAGWEDLIPKYTNYGGPEKKWGQVLYFNII